MDEVAEDNGNRGYPFQCVGKPVDLHLKLTRDLHLKLTHLLGPDYGL